jgi:hypothetical protein
VLELDEVWVQYDEEPVSFLLLKYGNLYNHEATRKLKVLFMAFNHLLFGLPSFRAFP